MQSLLAAAFATAALALVTTLSQPDARHNVNRETANRAIEPVASEAVFFGRQLAFFHEAAVARRTAFPGETGPWQAGDLTFRDAHVSVGGWEARVDGTLLYSYLPVAIDGLDGQAIAAGLSKATDYSANVGWNDGGLLRRGHSFEGASLPPVSLPGFIPDRSPVRITRIN